MSCASGIAHGGRRMHGMRVMYVNELSTKLSLADTKCPHVCSYLRRCNRPELVEIKVICHGPKQIRMWNTL